MDELWVLISCPANESTLMMCPSTNIEWSLPFWVSFHLLQVGADGIVHPEIIHHAFFCKLTLRSTRHFALVQHFAPHCNGIMCMLEVILHKSYNLSFYSKLFCSTLQQNVMCEDLFVHRDHCYNIIASSLPFLQPRLMARAWTMGTY